MTERSRTPAIESCKVRGIGVAVGQMARELDHEHPAGVQPDAPADVSAALAHEPEEDADHEQGQGGGHGLRDGGRLEQGGRVHGFRLAALAKTVSLGPVDLPGVDQAQGDPLEHDLDVIVAIAAPAIVPFPQDATGATNVLERLQPPSVTHPFGTDKVGQDVLYLSLKSIRTGLVIGTLTTLVMLPAAILLGIMAGYFRGWVDDVIQYLYTTLNSIPGVLLIAAAVLMLQVYMDNNAEAFTSSLERADMRLLFLCIILGVTSWTGLCRLLRGEALKIRELDYVQAAQAFGVGHFRILMRHLVPNVMHIVLIAVVLDFSGLVLAEAVLSYINIGVDPTTNSWGNMINSARLEMAREPIVWWSLFAAFLFMFSLVLAANLFSDVVRDAFDPRLKGKL